MILHSKKIGAILRVFAKKPEQVSGAVEQTLELVRKLAATKIEGRPVISRVEILVPRDVNYADVDCGDTANALRNALSDNEGAETYVYVSEVRHGDIFCGVLNYGMAKLLRSGCDYGFVASKEAASYFNQQTAEAMVKAVEEGARVTGIALNELTESVMHGRIANTMAMWHVMSLMQVGGFDLRAAKPKLNSAILRKVQAWDMGRNEQLWTYDLAGVEEIIPLVRLVETFGSCIAPILPKGEGVQIYSVPDPATDRDGYLRHMSKMGTKRERQTYFANSEGADLSYLMGGVIAEYRHPDYFR